MSRPRRPAPGETLALMPSRDERAPEWAPADREDVEVVVHESIGWAELWSVTQVIDGVECPGVLAVQPSGAWWWVRQPSAEEGQ